MWIGYLDTGASDVIFDDAPKVSLFPTHDYVMIEAGPAHAESWRAEWNRWISRGRATSSRPRSFCGSSSAADRIGCDLSIDRFLAASVQAPDASFADLTESLDTVAATTAEACPRRSVRLWVASAHSLSLHATRQLRNCHRPPAGRLR